jgi:2Fe-2S ferredoxin
MAGIGVTRRDGSHTTVDVEEGVSLMVGLRERGVDDIEGICGGYALCGTCHCYVDATNRARLPAQEAAERELLEGLMATTADSRLMCQVKCSAELDGLVVTVAPRE